MTGSRATSRDGRPRLALLTSAVGARVLGFAAGLLLGDRLVGFEWQAGAR